MERASTFSRTPLTEREEEKISKRWKRRKRSFKLTSSSTSWMPRESERRWLA
jgi:hypothetical protein